MVLLNLLNRPRGPDEHRWTLIYLSAIEWNPLMKMILNSGTNGSRSVGNNSDCESSPLSLAMGILWRKIGCRVGDCLKLGDTQDTAMKMAIFIAKIWDNCYTLFSNPWISWRMLEVPHHPIFRLAHGTLRWSTSFQSQQSRRTRGSSSHCPSEFSEETTGDGACGATAGPAGGLWGYIKVLFMAVCEVMGVPKLHHPVWNDGTMT